jgi:pimeloyl-ACP methyl ester carboxylesterase
MIPAPGGSLELADGRRLAYDDVGDPAGVPLVYLHGCPDSRLTRHPDDSIAVRAGVRLIAVDRPGYGSSDPPSDWTLESVARDVAALVDHLGLERCAVLGWSSGGSIALACAAAFPAKFGPIGLAAATVPTSFDGSVDEAVQEIVPLVVPADLTPSLALEHIREAKSAAYLNDLDSVSGLADQLVEGLLAATRDGLSGVEFDIRNLMTPWNFDVPAVEASVLLWYAECDDVVAPSVGAALADQLPRASLEIIEGASHLLPLVHWSTLLEEIALVTKETPCR